MFKNNEQGRVLFNRIMAILTICLIVLFAFWREGLSPWIKVLIVFVPLFLQLLALEDFNISYFWNGLLVIGVPTIVIFFLIEIFKIFQPIEEICKSFPSDLATSLFITALFASIITLFVPEEEFGD